MCCSGRVALNTDAWASWLTQHTPHYAESVPKYTGRQITFGNVCRAQIHTLRLGLAVQRIDALLAAVVEPLLVCFTGSRPRLLNYRSVSMRGSTPLHLAAKRGLKRTMQLMLKAGADAYQVNDVGHSGNYRPCPCARKTVSSCGSCHAFA